MGYVEGGENLENAGWVVVEGFEDEWMDGWMEMKEQYMKREVKKK